MAGRGKSEADSRSMARRMRARLPRGLLALLIAVGGSAMLFTASCGGPGYRCEGHADVTCAKLDDDRCSMTRGCTLTQEARCIAGGVSCEGKTPNTCNPKYCIEKGGTCLTICAAQPDEAACVDQGGTCVWIDGRCTSNCELITAPDACEADRLCGWRGCQGTPLACDQYSGDECPTWIGCEKNKSFAYSTQ